MRLLNTETLELATFIGRIPEYAILSHRWEDEEVTFEDLARARLSDLDSELRNKKAFAKIQGTCTLAAHDGFSWYVPSISELHI